MSSQNPKTPSRTLLVARKEIREVFRDKRTVFGVIISPLLIMPLLWAGMGVMIKSQTKQAQTETYKVGIVGGTNSPSVYQALKAVPNLEVSEVKAEEAEALVKDRKLRAVVTLPADTDAKISSSKTVAVKVMVDEGNDTSVKAAGRIQAGLTGAGQQLLALRLKSLNLPDQFATPFKIEQQPIKSGGSGTMLILASLVPYMLAMASFSGGIYAANDMVAGEKERNTLETLLVSPASRRELVLGKFLAVASVCTVSSFLSILGLMIPFFSKLPMYDWLVKGDVHLSFTAIMVLLMTQLPLAVLFAGALLVISTYARNQKEAQSYLGPVLLVVLVPAMMTMFLGSEVPKVYALVPVLNASLIVKQALANSFDFAFIAIAALASVVYAGLSVAFCTRSFEKESVLLKA